MDISKISIAELKQTLDKPADDRESLLIAMAEDPRAGVKKLYQAFQKKQEARENERRRLESLWRYERELWNQGFKVVAGVDEAGRGPLAGSVIAAAVVLPPNCMIEGLNDSKKISPQKRSELEKIIKSKAIAFAIGIIDQNEIDKINIYQASLKAMHTAVQELNVSVDGLLIDAVKIPDIETPQSAIVHGDSLSASIAAASILAKETRDRIMIELDKTYPQYGFAQHKGYGTAQHIEALKKYGPCPAHRKSFGQVCQNTT